MKQHYIFYRNTKTWRNVFAIIMTTLSLTAFVNSNMGLYAFTNRTVPEFYGTYATIGDKLTELKGGNIVKQELPPDVRMVLYYKNIASIMAGIRLVKMIYVRNIITDTELFIPMLAGTQRTEWVGKWSVTRNFVDVRFKPVEGNDEMVYMVPVKILSPGAYMLLLVANLNDLITRTNQENLGLFWVEPTKVFHGLQAGEQCVDLVYPSGPARSLGTDVDVKVFPCPKRLYKEFLARGKIVYKGDLFQHVRTFDEGGISAGYPIGEPIRSLHIGEIVWIKKIFPNDTISMYTLKVKTEKGETGYVLKQTVQVLSTLNDQGDLISIHLQNPYEFEGDVKTLSKIAKLYIRFILAHPNSQFIPEALYELFELSSYRLRLGDLRGSPKTSLVIRMQGYLDRIGRNRFCGERCRWHVNHISSYLKNYRKVVNTPWNPPEYVETHLRSLRLTIPSSLSDPRIEDLPAAIWIRNK